MSIRPVAWVVSSLCLSSLTACNLNWSSSRSEPTEADAKTPTKLDGGPEVEGGPGAGPEGGTCADGGARCSTAEVDECKSANGGCAHNCVDTKSAYECTCDPGFALGADQHTCVPFGFSEPVLLEVRDDGEARSAQVVVDAQGNATAVWSLTDCCAGNVWANRYELGKGWLGGEPIESNTGKSLNPHAAVDAQGNVMVVWDTSSSAASDRSIWATRYDARTGWGTPALLETNTAGNALAPRVALDAAGNAVAAWEQVGAARSHVVFNRYVVGAGWGSAALAEDDADTSSVRNVSLAPGAGGEVFAVWNRFTKPTAVWAGRYLPGSGWQAGAINAGGETVGEYPQIAGSGSGVVFAMWGQLYNGRLSAWASRSSGASWDPPVVLEGDDAADIYSQTVATDKSGTALAMWSRRASGESDRTPGLWAARYANGAWETALPVTPEGSNATDIALAMDGAGGAIAAWVASDGSGFDIWSSRFSPRSGWAMPELVERNNLGDARAPSVALDPAGRAFVSWLQDHQGRSSVWAVRLESCSAAGAACASHQDSCSEADAGATCTCPAGFRKVDAACVDINECTEGLDDCDNDPDACVNREGGFSCQCPNLYSGSGRGDNGCVSFDPWS